MSRWFTSIVLASMEHGTKLSSHGTPLAALVRDQAGPDAQDFCGATPGDPRLKILIEAA